MTEQSSKPSGWQRAQEAFKQAQVTVAVAGHVFSPVAGAAAVETHVVPVPDQQQYTQQVQQEEFHNYAESEKLQREREAGRLVRETTQDRKDRQDRQDLERGKSQARRHERGQ